MFIAQFVLTIYCDTYGLDWSYKTNFLTRALSWFLLGNYIHANQEKMMKWYSDTMLIVISGAGLVLSLIPIIFHTRINFSCIGVFFYAGTLFILSIKHEDLSLSKVIEYVGAKLSLNIYIFHVIIAGCMTVAVKKLLFVDTGSEIFLWIKPFITIGLTILWAYILEKQRIIQHIVKKTSN